MDKNLKILHIFPSFAHGGQQRRFAILANNLPGYEHHIVALDGDFSASSLLENQVVWEKHCLDLEKTSFISPANLRAYRALFTAHRPDLVCTYNWGSIEAVLANKIGLFGKTRHSHLHFEDGFGADETINQQKKQRVWARRIILKGVDVLVPSLGLKEAATTQWRLSGRRVHYVPNGVDIERFVPRETENQPIIIGTVGALRKEKNFARLLRVSAPVLKAGKAELHIVGTGPEEGTLRSLASDLDVQDQVRFCGASDRPEAFYQSFDIFCLTSDTEQMPFTVLEAMACGLPILATDVGDVRAMVAQENDDLIVPLGDDEAYAKKLSALVEHREARATLGTANRQKLVEHYALSKMLNAFDRLFKERILS